MYDLRGNAIAHRDSDGDYRDHSGRIHAKSRALSDSSDDSGMTRYSYEDAPTSRDKLGSVTESDRNYCMSRQVAHNPSASDHERNAPSSTRIQTTQGYDNLVFDFAATFLPGRSTLVLVIIHIGMASLPTLRFTKSIRTCIPRSLSSSGLKALQGMVLHLNTRTARAMSKLETSITAAVRFGTRTSSTKKATRNTQHLRKSKLLNCSDFVSRLSF